MQCLGYKDYKAGKGRLSLINDRRKNDNDISNNDNDRKNNDNDTKKNDNDT
jgi:hypothetical protein